MPQVSRLQPTAGKVTSREAIPLHTKSTYNDITWKWCHHVGSHPGTIWFWGKTLVIWCQECCSFAPEAEHTMQHPWLDDIISRWCQFVGDIVHSPQHLESSPKAPCQQKVRIRQPGSGVYCLKSERRMLLIFHWTPTTCTFDSSDKKYFTSQWAETLFLSIFTFKRLEGYPHTVRAEHVHAIEQLDSSSHVLNIWSKRQAGKSKGKLLKGWCMQEW